MKKMIAAAALLASVFVLQTPAMAENDRRAQLRLTVVDQTNAPVPNADVTLFTMYGPRTASTDEKGVIVFADLPEATAQWWVRTPGHVAHADAARLKSGQNKQTVTLKRQGAESGSY
jgi:hypothetical protein